MFKDVKGALTRKFGPAPAWVWLSAFAVAVYWWRSKHTPAGSSNTAAGVPAGVDLGTLADLGYTAVPTDQFGGGSGSGGGSGPGGGKKPPRPKRRHHKPKPKGHKTPKTHHRPPNPKPHHQPPVHHPRTHKGHDKPRTPVRGAGGGGRTPLPS